LPKDVRTHDFSNSPELRAAIEVCRENLVHNPEGGDPSTMPGLTIAVQRFDVQCLVLLREPQYELVAAEDRGHLPNHGRVLIVQELELMFRHAGFSSRITAI